MAVTITGSITNFDFAGGGSITTTVNIPVDCDLVLIAISYGAFTITPGPVVNSVTLGGSGVTAWPGSAIAVTNGVDFGRAVWYAMKSPPTGPAVTIDIQMSGGTNGHAVVIPLVGSHFTSWQGTANTNSNPASANVSTLGTGAQVGGLVLDTVGLADDVTTVDAGQTQLWNNGDATGRSCGSDKAGAPSVDMLWTINNPRPWAQSVVPVHPAITQPSLIGSFIPPLAWATRIRS